MLTPSNQINLTELQTLRENAEIAANQEPLERDSLPVRTLIAAGHAIDHTNFSLQSAIVLPFLEKCYTPGGGNIQRLVDTAWFFERIKLRRGPFMYSLVDAVEKTELFCEQHALNPLRRIGYRWLASYDQTIDLFNYFVRVDKHSNYHPLPILKHLSSALLVDNTRMTTPQIIKVIRFLSRKDTDRAIFLPFRDRALERLEQMSVSDLTNLLKSEGYLFEKSVREDFDPFANRLTQLIPAMNLDDFFKVLEVIGRYDEPDTIFYTDLLRELPRGIQRHAGQMSISQISFIFRRIGFIWDDVDKDEIDVAVNSLIRRIPAVVDEINPEQVDPIIDSIVDIGSDYPGWSKDRERAILALIPYVGSLDSRGPSTLTHSSILMAFWIGKYCRRGERTEAALSFLVKRIREDLHLIDSIWSFETVVSAFNHFGLRNSDIEMLVTAIAGRISAKIKESKNLYFQMISKIMHAFTTYNLHNEEIDEMISLSARFCIDKLELLKESGVKDPHNTYQQVVPEWLSQLAWAIGEYNLRNEETLSAMKALEQHLPAAIDGMAPLMIARAVYGFAKFDLRVLAMKGTVDALTMRLNKLYEDKSKDELTQSIRAARQIVFPYYLNELTVAQSSSSSSSQQLASSEYSGDPPSAKKARPD